MKALFTADTGASRTVISQRLFNKIPADQRPYLKPSSCLIGAGGAPIREKGKAEFTLKLGEHEMVREVIVAEIEDEALLGFDILRGEKNGAADILLSKNRIVLDGKDIPCFQVSKNKTRRVVMAEDFQIPGSSEAVVDVFIERSEEDDFDPDHNYIVAPTDNFTENYHLLMATTLVDINTSPTCKVRILNPHHSEITLRQDAVIGMAEKIERVVSVLQKQENRNEDSNVCHIKRIQRRQEETNLGENQLPKAKPEDVPVHLKKLFEDSASGKNELEQQMVAGLLVKYQASFSKNEWDLGLTHLTEHPINTGDAAPVKQRPRRVPLAYADEERKAIEDLIQKGVIQKSTSPWASPIVLVRKKSGAVRPCIDYRRVNALVKPDGFPLPRVQDCLDAVAGSSLFSSFDLTSGYFQIPLKKDDIPKSAFCCKFGHYEMTRMPFGLNNASGTFQRTMELALQGLQWITCLVYIDDIIVFGENFTQHLSRVMEVLERIKQAGLKLKPEKCRMLQSEVVFLGHTVSKDGIMPDPTNIVKIVQWPTPQNAKQVKQFVATGSYYRRFVENFAKIARPLINLTKKGVEFLWTDACEIAFNKIKEALISPEVMGYPLNDGGEFLLDVDASGEGIGGVLQQMQDGRERVIAYGSRALNKAERNYCITEKELLAVIFFIQYYRQYLLGRKFTVRSDHQALVWLFNLKEPNGKIARWIEILAAYDFNIEYRAGSKQGHCDALSRCPTPRDCTCSEVDMSEPLKCGPCKKCRKRAQDMMLQFPGDSAVKLQEWSAAGHKTSAMGSNDHGHNRPTLRGVQAGVENAEPVAGPSHKVDVAYTNSKKQSSNWIWEYTPENLVKEQMEDPDIAPILLAKQGGVKPPNTEMVSQSPATRHYWIIWESLEIKEGVLFKQFRKGNDSDSYCQLIAPRSMKRDIMYQMHNSIVSGHMGVKRTKQKTSRSYYWYNMKPDIALYIKKCDTCAADKKPAKTPRAPMGSLRVGAPWDVLAIDYLGPLPRTPRDSRYILVLTDHFSKYTEVLPVSSQSAEECAQRILDGVIARWGAPLAIHSDQGGTFESRVFKELCKLLEVKKTRTSPRHPRGNGQTERFNRTLLKMIKAYLIDEQEDWDLHLGCLAGAYNATPNESSSLTPNMLTMGHEIRLPANIIFGHENINQENASSYCDYVAALQEKMMRAHDIARKYLGRSSKRSKELYDSKLSFHKYKVGDIVWCLKEARKVGVTPKLEKTYQGPFLIKEKYSDLNFVLQFDESGDERVLHHDKLKLYEGDNPSKWLLRASKKLARERAKLHPQ